MKSFHTLQERRRLIEYRDSFCSMTVTSNILPVVCMVEQPPTESRSQLSVQENTRRQKTSRQNNLRFMQRLVKCFQNIVSIQEMWCYFDLNSLVFSFVTFCEGNGHLKVSHFTFLNILEWVFFCFSFIYHKIDSILFYP